MVVEEKFLRTIDSYQLACYFDKDKKIKDHITLDLGENYSVKNKSNYNNNNYYNNNYNNKNYQQKNHYNYNQSYSNYNKQPVMYEPEK